MDITGLVAVLGAFGIGPAIVYLRSRHKIEERKLELQARNGNNNPGETRRLIEENKLLRERVENLESIVCSVDFELNQKLAKVIDEQRSLLIPPLVTPMPTPMPTPTPTPPPPGGSAAVAGAAAMAATAPAAGGAGNITPAIARPGTSPAGFDR